jgi:hypothetical protein
VMNLNFCLTARSLLENSFKTTLSSNLDR